MQNRKTTVLILIILLLAMLLAACGGSGRPTATPGPAGGITNPTIVVEAAETMGAWSSSFQATRAAQPGQ